jgi:serine/threonine protein kinase/CheY-like chemotaxis protein
LARKILLVEDSPTSRKLTQRRLEQAGYEVVAVGEGIRALEVLAKEHIDLVLLDIMLPDINGLDVLERIRNEHSNLSLPVLMATARSKSADVVTALRLGANDYVTKPLDFPVALARIQSHLDLLAQATSQNAARLVLDGVLKPGFVVDGRYELLRRIGEGGFGAVYKARQLSTGQTVALKFLHAERLTRDGSHGAEVARFEREIQLIAQMQHPHVVRLIDSGRLRVRAPPDRRTTERDPSADPTLTEPTEVLRPSSPDRRVARCDSAQTEVPYLVMEYLEGETLSAFLARAAPLPVDEAIDLMLPALSAIAAAHEMGVVHRDIKPANVLLMSSHDGAPHPKVLDFGVAKLLGDDAATLTRTSAVIGTPKYLSPEQARGHRDIDGRSDLYALATILYEAITGTHPYTAEQSLEYVHLIATGVVEPPSRRVASLPDGFEEVLLRGLRSLPDARYASVAEFALVLLPFASAPARVRWSRAFGAGATPPRGGSAP